MKVERKKLIKEQADQRRSIHFQKLEQMKQEIAKQRFDKLKSTLEKNQDI